jgi:DNA mismatch endonuclease, patch repair protein
VVHGTSLEQTGTSRVEVSGLSELRPSSDAVSRRMSVQRRRDTEPEVLLRRELHRRGYRFRVNYPVPGRRRRTIDIAFTRHRLAVFVDGCFWHACPTHATWPGANSTWWRQKLEGNRERDTETEALLAEAGWTVLRIWEHEGVADAARLVAEELPRRRASKV